MTFSFRMFKSNSKFAICADYKSCLLRQNSACPSHCVALNKPLQLDSCVTWAVWVLLGNKIEIWWIKSKGKVTFVYCTIASTPLIHYRFPYFGPDLLRLTSPSARHQLTVRDLGYGQLYHAMCLFTPPAFAGYSSHIPMEGWLGLSWSRCLVLHRGGLPSLKQSPIQAHGYMQHILATFSR